MAPLWQATFNRTGRRYGLRALARGIDPEFETQSGFINRGGIAHMSLTNQLSSYGRPGGAVERFGPLAGDQLHTLTEGAGR